MIRRRFIPLIVLGLLFVAPAPARSFDWAGKLARDLEFLQSPSATLRRRAVYRLARYPKKKIARHLLDALDDTDPGVQRAAAEVATA
ncbi:MAG: HEAT repeat domain-containing protein, partial [Deltaproteobacteria bacterium]|nr:HEAT repeat domain-containing protein [Deltaproteobacteria bacterium]